MIDTTAETAARSRLQPATSSANLASGSLDYEVAYIGGRRLVPAAVAREVAFARPANIRPGSTWVITGGARGITAACALEFGRRFGLKLHVIGEFARWRRSIRPGTARTPPACSSLKAP